MNDRTGQQIGSYRLTWLLGRGGFAEVYLAEHVLLKTMVAIKLLLPPSAENKQRFLEEARTVAHLVHPHIVRLLHFDIDPKTDWPYLVMDYAPHGSLRQRHPKGTKLPLPTIVSYVSQIASALQYAHDNRIIHLDIKPENMLLNARNDILLSDFGLATIAHSSTSMKTQEEAGTIHYMPPEQIRGKPRPASDQYALAVTIYQWLCGVFPFLGNNTIDIAMQHMNDAPPSLRNSAPDVTPIVEQVVFKALAKDPQQRYNSILAFAIALEQASLYKVQPLPPLLQTKQLTPLPPIPDSRPVSLVSNPQTPIPEPIQHPMIVDTKAPYVLTDQPTSSIFAAQKMASSSLPNWQINSSIGLFGTGRVSRRTAVFVGVGTGVGIIGGGLIWFFASLQKGVTATNTKPSPTPTLAPIPLGTLLFTYERHIGFVYTVAWSPNGKSIASGATDKTVQIWNVDGSGQPYIYEGHTNAVEVVAWSPNGKSIASGSDDHTVQVWNVDGSGLPFVYKGHNSYVYAVAWSPDGKRIASGALYKTVQVWNVDGSGLPFVYKGHSNSILSIAWSPDGTRVASSSADKTVQIWNVDGTGKPFIYKGHSDVVQSVAWSPDGMHIVSSSADKTVQIWNVDGTGQPFIYKGHNKGVWAVAWSPDGRDIASGSLDKTVQVWSADGTGQPFTYKGHNDYVVAVAWSPDGTRVVSGSIDKTVQIWAAR